MEPTGERTGNKLLGTIAAMLGLMLGCALAAPALGASLIIDGETALVDTEGSTDPMSVFDVEAAPIELTALPPADDTNPFALVAFDTPPDLAAFQLTIPELAASPLAVDLSAQPFVVDEFQGVDIPEPPAVVLGLFALAALAVIVRAKWQRTPAAS